MKNNKQNTPIKIGRFIDPMTDFGFKRIFGSEPNKDILIAFLNDLFAGRKVITDLEYEKNENHGPQKGYRSCIYDLRCTGQDNSKFLIEVQRLYQEFFTDRAIFYTSALVHELGQVGGDVDWDYQLNEVYFIGILDFCLDDTDPEDCVQWFAMSNMKSHKLLTEKYKYIFIELPKFNKSEEDLKTDLDVGSPELRPQDLELPIK